MADEPQKNERTVPLPIKLAQEALKILEAEGGATEGLSKSLPAFAMQLSKAGEEVTVEILLARAREGIAPPADTQKPLTYAEVVADLERRANSGAKEKAPDKHKSLTRQLCEAAKEGKIDVMLRLLDAGAMINRKDSLGNTALTWAISGGRTDVVRLLLEKGARVNDKNITGSTPLTIAVAEEQTDIARLLLEKGAEVDAKDNRNQTPLFTAVSRGNIECVRLLLDKNAALEEKSIYGYTALMLATYRPEIAALLLDRGANIHEKNSEGWTALTVAAMAGQAASVSLLLDRGADPYDADGDGRTAPMWAMMMERTEIVNLFVEKGTPLAKLPPELQENYHAYWKGREHWEKTMRCLPPTRLWQQNTAYFRSTTFKAVKDMLLTEHIEESYANKMAFAATALFGTEQRVLQYLSKWGKTSIVPLRDMLDPVKAPLEASADTKAWGDAALKCGPGMAALFRYADRLPQPEKSSDGKTWSYHNTREKAAKLAFTRGGECPELAALCFEHHVEEKLFNAALALVQTQKKGIVKNLPEIVIDGKSFGMEGASFHKLAANDVRGLFLGEITNCCQSIGGMGASCATDGFMSENSGFYVVEKDNKILGETWAWRGKKGELVFDSLETLGGRVTPEQWKSVADEFAKALAENKSDITALHIGTGGGTVRSLPAKAFNTAASPAQPIGYSGYRDSREQAVVWKRPVPRIRAFPV